MRVFGRWAGSASGTPTFFVEQAVLVHRFDGALPDKRHGLSDDRRHLARSLDLATNETSFSFALQCADIVGALRDVLRRWGFREFNTGTLQRVFEGGLAVPFATQCKANGQQYFLSLTSELKLKRLVAAGAERVCEITQSFRNEGLSRVHSPEFTLLEAYGVDMTHTGMMTMVEEMVLSAARCVPGAAAERLLASGSFPRRSYAELCKEHLGVEFPTLDLLVERLPGQFQPGMPLFTWVMKLLETVIGPTLLEPVFVTELPAGLSPLVKRSSHDERVTDRAFLFAGGYFICDIYADENDPAILERELKAQANLTGRAVDDEYLQCIRLGLPPTAGVGLGVNRLQMLFLPGTLPTHIRETILYPLG